MTEKGSASMEKFRISCDTRWYEAWPDVTLCPDGRVLVVFTQCVHHGDRSNTRLMLTESADDGRTWGEKRALTPESAGTQFSYNCARLTTLRDGRLAAVVDCLPREGEKESFLAKAKTLLYLSSDNGRTWDPPKQVPLAGIVPSKLTELAGGRWLISAHRFLDGRLAQYLIYSDDGGASWSDEVLVAYDRRYNLCEGALCEFPEEHAVVCFLRENSGLGLDCQKVVSYDGGEHWSPVVAFPLPGCHRPVAGRLADGQLLLTYRFSQGGKGWLGTWTQNFFGAFSDTPSALAIRREDSWTRVFPIDFDRSSKSDLGYSGWVQLENGELLVVSYIVDDAVDRGQIRGYRFFPGEFSLP